MKYLNTVHLYVRDDDKDFRAGVYDSTMDTVALFSLDLKLQGQPDKALLKLARGYMARFHRGRRILGACVTKNGCKIVVAFVPRETWRERALRFFSKPL